MLLTIDFTSEQPIYRQIRNGIVAGIATGQLQDGDSLPSVRTMGADIGVNLHTVNKAYKQLQSEGFLEIQRNRGAVIRAGEAEKNTVQFLEVAEFALKNIVMEAATRNVDRAVIHKILDNLYDELRGNA
jgi:GntR family transcriptional regulator